MKCKVLLNNDAVTVIDYDGKKVQMPSIKCNKSIVNVVRDGDRFTVVPDDYIETVVKQPSKKKKKTTKNVEKSESCIVFE